MTQSYSWAWNCLSVVVTCLKKNVLCQWSLSKKSVFLEWTVNRRPADARPQVAGWPLGNVLLADRLRYISTPTVGPPPRPVPFHPMCLRLLETFDCVSFWRIKGKRCRKWRLSWKRCSCLFASVDSWLAGNYEKPVCVRCWALQGWGTCGPRQHLIWPAEEFSLPNLEYKIASKQISLISRYLRQ